MNIFLVLIPIILAAFSVSVFCVDRESANKRPFAAAAILELDFGTSTPFYSPALALNTPLALSKYLGCVPNSSAVLTKSDVLCVQQKLAANMVMTSYNLGVSWDMVVDGDYVLNISRGQHQGR